MTTRNPREQFADHRLFELETPCYVYDPTSVIDSYQKLKASLGTRLIVSLKANSSLDLLLRCMHAFSDGIELASIGELEISVGRTKVPKYVNNPAMGLQFIRAAIAAKATLVLDNLDQIALLREVRGTQKLAPVMLRMNSCVLDDPANPQALSKSDHFGMDFDTANDAISMLGSAGIEVMGIHLFTGSTTFFRHPYHVVEHIGKAADRIEQRLGKSLSLINLGGGFDWDWDDRSFDFSEYRTRLAPLIARYDVAHEAGRAIYQRAGAFLTRVIAVKRMHGNCFVVCDGGMSQNFLLCRTESVIKRYAAPRLIRRQSIPDGAREEQLVFTGSSCNRSDIIGHSDGPTVVPQVGDLCRFDNCGAYHQSYTVSNFLNAKKSNVYLCA